MTVESIGSRRRTKKLRLTLRILFWSLFVAGCLGGQPRLDNAGNSFLNGKYFFRWVIYAEDQGALRQATAAYGTINFDGRGTYQIDGRITDSLNSSGSARPFTPA